MNSNRKVLNVQGREKVAGSCGLSCYDAMTISHVGCVSAVSGKSHTASSTREAKRVPWAFWGPSAPLASPVPVSFFFSW